MKNDAYVAVVASWNDFKHKLITDVSWLWSEVGLIRLMLILMLYPGRL